MNEEKSSTKVRLKKTLNLITLLIISIPSLILFYLHYFNNSILAFSSYTLFMLLVVYTYFLFMSEKVRSLNHLLIFSILVLVFNSGLIYFKIANSGLLIPILTILGSIINLYLAKKKVMLTGEDVSKDIIKLVFASITLVSMITLISMLIPMTLNF